MKRAAALLLAGALFAVLAPSTVAAQTGPALTLTASDGSIRFGEHVVLSGSLEPAAGGEAIEILDGSSTVVATASLPAGKSSRDARIRFARSSNPRSPFPPFVRSAL